MTTKEEIFSNQISLILQAVELINEKIELIRQQKDDRTENTIVRVFKVRSLILYRDTLQYIAQEIKRLPTAKTAFFLLPHARTLIDVQARFLHLLINCIELDRQALVCFAYQACTYRALEGKEQYAELLSQNQSFLNQQTIKFPSELSGLSNNWVEKMKLNFPSKNKILTAENIKNYSSTVKGVFNTQKPYEIYRYLSEFLHGNPYQYSQGESNEKFWVVSIAIMTSAFLIEQIDEYTLRKGLARDFREWLTGVKNSIPQFTNLWSKRREELKLKRP